MLINVNKNFKKVLKKPLKGASLPNFIHFNMLLLRKHGAQCKIIFIFPISICAYLQKGLELVC